MDGLERETARERERRERELRCFRQRKQFEKWRLKDMSADIYELVFKIHTYICAHFLHICVFLCISRLMNIKERRDKYLKDKWTIM